MLRLMPLELEGMVGDHIIWLFRNMAEISYLRSMSVLDGAEVEHLQSLIDGV